MGRETGIKDINGRMVHEGDIVVFPRLNENQRLRVVYIGHGDDMDWAADKLTGEPDSWLSCECEIVD